MYFICDTWTYSYSYVAVVCCSSALQRCVVVYCSSSGSELRMLFHTPVNVSRTHSLSLPLIESPTNPLSARECLTNSRSVTNTHRISHELVADAPHHRHSRTFVTTDQISHGLITADYRISHELIATDCWLPFHPSIAHHPQYISRELAHYHEQLFTDSLIFTNNHRISHEPIANEPSNLPRTHCRGSICIRRGVQYSSSSNALWKHFPAPMNVPRTHSLLRTIIESPTNSLSGPFASVQESTAHHPATHHECTSPHPCTVPGNTPPRISHFTAQKQICVFNRVCVWGSFLYVCVGGSVLYIESTCDIHMVYGKFLFVLYE